MKSPSLPLAAGQVWKLKDRYLRVSRVGKTLVEYKLMRKLGQRAVQSQMASQAIVLKYLKANKARLVLDDEPVE